MGAFSEGIVRSVAKINLKLELVRQKVALGAFTEVILMSPVDTGRFRGNWQVGVGQIAVTYDESLMDPSGQSVIAGVRATVSSLKADDITVWLVNGLPYAIPLEYGWSNQAPGGMVRLTVQRWHPIVEQAVKELNNL